MKRLLALSIILLGAGCAAPSLPLQDRAVIAPLDNDGAADETTQAVMEPQVVLPIAEDLIGYLPIYRRYGEFFNDGRFYGYHTGEDAEVPLDNHELPEIPVRAVADGEVVFASQVGGYGGVVILQHEIDGEQIQTLYGHLDIDSMPYQTGDIVAKGAFLANLGKDKSPETDGERKHLHFAVYRGTEIRLAGYVTATADLSAWINPQDFFREHGAVTNDDAEWISTDVLWYPDAPPQEDPLRKTEFAELSFAMPPDWDVEYVPSIEALNLFVVMGEGSARERSQIFVRYFDANDFLTLSTVDILEQYDLTVGSEDYFARRYIIEKKTGIADFADQPEWRNDRHTVTDFRVKQGFTRYYVVAANPALDPALYEQVLESMRIQK